jgi:hypothetical protein
MWQLLLLNKKYALRLRSSEHYVWFESRLNVYCSFYSLFTSVLFQPLYHTFVQHSIYHFNLIKDINNLLRASSISGEENNRMNVEQLPNEVTN